MAIASLVLPGAGHVARGRIGTGLLFLWVAGWLHLTMAGLAHFEGPEVSRLDGFLYGAFAFRGVGIPPEATVFTVLLVALRIAAAWDALHPSGVDRRGGGRETADGGSTEC